MLQDSVLETFVFMRGFFGSVVSDVSFSNCNTKSSSVITAVYVNCWWNTFHCVLFLVDLLQISYTDLFTCSICFEKILC